MSQHKRCDHCGKEQRVLSSGWARVKIISWWDSDFDLCAECVKELRAWLRAK